MAPLSVHIKHAGKIYDISLDPDLPPTFFKDAVYTATGVPVERMKVMVKGGVLKDNADWKKIGPKEGQTFMVIGAAGELPKPPEKPIVFLEDMDDLELAEALAKPVGLQNLGNTCYMNATLQSLRAIPELQSALNAPHSTQTSSPLPKSLKELYNQMGKTTNAVMPFGFLQVLRTVVPQFGEMDRREGGRGGPAQQDAEECWTQISNAIKDVPGLPSAGSGGGDGTTAVTGGKTFVEQWMMGEILRELKCDESESEPPTTSTEKILKIECNISTATSFMLTGIMDALNQKLEKTSPSLGREAIYSQRSRLTRLPGYLTVHMVRFAWRRDIGKKAKIMRKVKFPNEFDALDIVTDDLRNKLLPVSRKLKEVEKERSERRKVRRRTKRGVVSKEKDKGGDVEMGDATSAPPGLVPLSSSDAPESSIPSASTTTATTATAAPAADATATTTENKGKAREEGGELDEESVYRDQEIKELEALVDPGLKADLGCSVSGLYDLVAIVTHKGAAADAGHYIGFVKKSVFHPPPLDTAADDDDDWYKFDDDKVSVFPKEKLGTLDGGGEDSSAYVLLYKSKSLS